MTGSWVNLAICQRGFNSLYPKEQGEGKGREFDGKEL